MPFGINAADCIFGFEMARLTRKASAQFVEFCFSATPHVTSRSVGPSSNAGGKRRIVCIDGKNRAAVERFEARMGFVVRDFFKPQSAKSADR